jgi:SOS response regulatory protein OraA/RecX
MNERERLILMQYILNQRTCLERELKQYVQNVRYREFDVVDCLELILLKEKLAMFNQVIKDVFMILNLKKYVDDEENII